ncbi:hypothetical protein [Paenibacillus sp. CFBP13512]|uniref:hypothetical protein n=1 Tax=Paenibacillus sp. CFBP13512 TaxID=2184007 RepID=UPI001F4F5FA1|nr:hypothetical protein [Paenibacillus sp. CFBP13512]
MAIMSKLEIDWSQALPIHMESLAELRAVVLRDVLPVWVGLMSIKFVSAFVMLLNLMIHG